MKKKILVLFFATSLLASASAQAVLLAATVFSGGLAIGIGIWGGISLALVPFGNDNSVLGLLAGGLILSKDGQQITGSSAEDLERNLKFYPQEMHTDIVAGVEKIQQVKTPFIINVDGLTREQAIHLVMTKLDVKAAAAEYVLDTAGLQTR